MRTRRDRVIDAAAKAGSVFMYYDRKEDEDLPVGEIEAAVRAGEITEGEILKAFEIGCGWTS